ncbi:MAG: LLM class F420-dependent oxidoreductase [Deltaproteobacteria bacterium]|nr:MAG: LLM class F420-dependent oxidoreductase [Deltaproteobacteria bacterium]
MKVDVPLMATDLGEVPEEAARVEQLGYSGAFTFEGQHDPFFPLLLAAHHTERLELATAIAVAFPRSPMHLANIGHDLQVFSRGRFILGLGSQIRAHIERRFSAVWDRPVARMRELVQAVRAIWRCWNEGEKLDFRGEFYQHTLMAPFFNPGPSPYGPPRIFLAGVGKPMTRVAGEVGDGLFVHPLHSVEFIRQVTLPALSEGFRRGGRSRDRFEIACQVLLVTGYDEEEVSHADIATRMQLAFYCSTPAYRVVLEQHGWGELQEELRSLSKQGRWVEMAGLIDDAMMEQFTVRCAPGDVAPALKQRYEGLVDRIHLICHSNPHERHPDRWSEVIRAIQDI